MKKKNKINHIIMFFSGIALLKLDFGGFVFPLFFLIVPSRSDVISDDPTY